MQFAFSYAFLLAGIFLSLMIFKIVLNLMFADKVESSKSAKRVKSVKDSIFGRARTHDDWIPDARVKGGLVFNSRKKRIEVTGRLSDSALNRVFRNI